MSRSDEIADIEKTEQTAISALKKLYDCLPDDEYKYAVGVGIKSCTIQLPTRPYKTESGEALCPWCFMLCNKRNTVPYEDSCCPRCGQRIDWRDWDGKNET